MTMPSRSARPLPAPILPSLRAAGVSSAILATLLGASGSAAAQEIAVLGAPSDPTTNGFVRDTLMCTGDFDHVDVFDVGAFTPGLLDLQQYHAVLVYSEEPFQDPVALGDVLAEYVEQGHGVVLAVGAFAEGTELGGRFITAGHSPVTTGPLSFPGGDIGYVILPQYYWLPGGIYGHDTVYGVNSFSGGDRSTQVADLELVPPAYITMEWANGEPLTVVMEPADKTIGRTAAVNLFPGPGWVGDGDRIMGQALNWTLGVGRLQGCINTYATQDFNCNGTDVADEPAIDVTLPDCDDRDPWTGEPVDNNDYYYDYFTNGCKYFVAGDDIDLNAGMEPSTGDLLLGIDPAGQAPSSICDSPPCGLGKIVEAGGAFTASLSCDNCAFDYNPEQADRDCDTVGDLCDSCPDDADSQNLNICPFTGLPDGDCEGNVCDNCPCAPNNDQSDLDRDDVGDVCDNCILTFNDQADSDVCPPYGLPDGWGDACDNCPFVCNPAQGDVDLDAVGDECDNCITTGNPDQADADGDGQLRDLNCDGDVEAPPDGAGGDACDACPNLTIQEDCIGGVPGASHDHSDPDNDRWGNACDNCPNIPNEDQRDFDGDGAGDSCDNCPEQVNRDQHDSDQDGIGDVCDGCPLAPDTFQEDNDGDGRNDACDNCPEDPNPPGEDGKQRDQDLDNIGDECDNCPIAENLDQLDVDGDRVGDVCDNCVNDSNADQANEDGDNLGDICDTIAIRGGGGAACSTTEGVAGWAAVAFALATLRRRRSVR